MEIYLDPTQKAVKVANSMLQSKIFMEVTMGRPKMTGYEAHLHKVLYGRWKDMIDRCRRPKNPAYKNYGGRGISVCIEWLNFKEFEKWALSNGFEPRLTIDRIDVDGDYCPENCRWVTMKEQQRNRSNNHLITYKGRTLTISQWAEERNINHDTLFSRINKRHWEIGMALEYE